MTLTFSALLICAGIVLVSYGLATRDRTRRETLEEILEIEMAAPDADPQRLSELVARAGAVADRAMSRTAYRDRVRQMLGQAGWALRPGEYAAVSAAAAAAGGLVCALVLGSTLVGVCVATGVPLGSVWYLHAKGRRRIRRIDDQLPTVLQLLAGSLDSGASVLHAMELVVEEGDPPLSDEFARVVAETRVGRPLMEAMEAMAARAGSRDLDWTVEAIRIQHATGGRLADTLRILAEFMRQRLEIRGEVRALSAEARLSARVLTALPIGVGAFFAVFRASYIAPLFETGPGRLMLVVAATGIVVGSLWMRRIVRVEV